MTNDDIVTVESALSPEDRLLVWLVAAGIFMQTLDGTIVNTALPSMARSLHESPLRMQSVVIVYSLTMAMIIPASGWLADRFGTRAVFISAIIVFTIGSALCATSGSLHQLVAWRMLQGAGASMLLPVGRLALLRGIPRSRFLAAMSLVTIPGLVGPLIGPTLGGWLAEYSSWHWIFLINVPVGILGGAATMRWMPQLLQPRPASFDLTGYVMIAVAMVSISLALDGLSELKLHHTTIMLMLIFGLGALTAYWLHASQKPEPLFAPDLFSVRSFTVGLLGNLFARLGSGSAPFLLPLALQVGLGMSPAQAGVMMIPTVLAAMVSKRVVTALILRHGYRRILMYNTALVGMCIASFALLERGQPWWWQLPLLLLFGAANSLQFSAMNTLTLKDLSLQQTGGGNSVLSMVQMVAMGLGVAVAAAILESFTEKLGVDHTAPEVLSAFHWTFLSVGALTVFAVWIFAQLSADEPRYTDGASAVDV